MARRSVRTNIVTEENDVRPSTAEELGLTLKAIHEARQIRDAAEVEALKPARRMRHDRPA
jgi:hypothetical protein